MISDLNRIECMTLFVEDLKATRKFYEDIFAAKPVFEDPHSVVVRFENISINLLDISQSQELITPAKVATQVGSRFMLTITVKDVDAVCEKLKQKGVTLLNGPINRPWGRRTAAFSDPAGNAWEVAQEI